MKTISFHLAVLLLLLGQNTYVLDFKGSLGEGKLNHCIPSVSNPLFNESLYITTEVRPIFLHNKIPNDLVTSGGAIDIFAVQVRVALNDRWGLQGNVGYNLALDSEHDSSMVHGSIHLDYMVSEKFYPLIELNSFSVMSHGDRLPFGFEGIDLVNFGSWDTGTVSTFAVGARILLTDKISLGAAYEFPISSREDIMDWRTYVDLVITF